MDDIRKPQRRDYTLPASRPYAPRPPHSARQPHQPMAHHQHPPAQPQHQTQPHPAPAPHTIQSPKRLGKKLSIAIGAILAAAAIFGAGWLLKGSGTQSTVPSSITRQVNYSLYFPSPMPPGYIYMKESATFQIGQVYYKFSKGNKRVTVNEQPMPGKKPDLSLMSGYRLYDSPVGQAAIGSSFGQATAVVLTKTTVITMNSVGGVSQQELETAINNLKLIGQNPQKT